MNHDNIIDFPRKITLGNFSVQKGQKFNVLGHVVTVIDVEYNQTQDCWLIKCVAGEGEYITDSFVWKYFKNGIMVEADIQEILC